MKKIAQADLQRWSEEVARDPASLAFLPLARAYRRQGQRDAARQLCVRGLEHYPTHAEAHSLLALLYLEDGDRSRAADEWSMVLRMDPNHFEALRGIGFCYLEQDMLSRARQALERAALLRPMDAAVQEALAILGNKQDTSDAAQGTASAAPAQDTPAAPAATSQPKFQLAGEGEAPRTAASAEAVLAAFTKTSVPPEGLTDEQWAASMQPPAPVPVTPAVRAAVSQAAPAEPVRNTDPSALFASLMGSGPLLGVLLLDAQGLVLAGALGDGTGGSADMLGATLGPAINEATRTVSLLSLGGWRGMLLEAETAVLHVSPVQSDAVLLIAAKRNAPTGWVLRAASQAADVAGRYLQEYA
jgi:predicted regulator of Ras-like GTPase activity (Roadblock/LC7/MglB family)